MVYFTLGQAIYMAVKPMFKIYIVAGVGFIMAKTKLLNIESIRTLSQMVLKYLIPCLIFANIVGSIKSTDIKTLGIIILTASLYFLLGAIWACIVRLTSPIPRCWLGGLFMACILNNSGDLPIAYVQTLGSGDQFDPNATTKGTAYVVLYSISFIAFLFNFGGSRLIERDAKSTIPNKYDPTVPAISIASIKRLFKPKVADAESEPKPPKPESEPGTRCESFTTASEPIRRLHTNPLSRVSTHEDVFFYANTECLTVAPSHQFEDLSADEESQPAQLSRTTTKASTIITKSGWHRFLRRFRQKWHKYKQKNMFTYFVLDFFENLQRPQAASLVLSLTFAMIPWVKRVFVNDPHQVIHGISDAPDGKPPLDFIMDTTRYLGQTQVPIGLLLLGATIGRLKLGAIPKGFWKTVVLIVVYKLVFLPIVAIAWCYMLIEKGWIARDDHMLPVVLVSAAATPPATVQVYLTTLFQGVDDPPVILNCFSIVLVIAYLCLPITMSIAITYVMKNLF